MLFFTNYLILTRVTTWIDQVVEIYCSTNNSNWRGKSFKSFFTCNCSNGKLCWKNERSSISDEMTWIDAMHGITQREIDQGLPWYIMTSLMPFNWFQPWYQVLDFLRTILSCIDSSLHLFNPLTILIQHKKEENSYLSKNDITNYVDQLDKSLSSQ